MMDQFIINSGLYVDDDNLVYNILPPGTRWNMEEKKMIIENSKVSEDLEERGDKRTMVEIIKMANSICPTIQPTEDYPNRNSDEAAYIGLERLARSAMSARVKRATMIQEAIMILKNTIMCVPGRE